jgi:hypothetical protein
MVDVFLVMKLLETGMEFDSFKVDGQMGHHASHNALFKQTRHVYNFTITGKRGTLFWHTHFSWLRATVYGPLIIFPKQNVS